jgi:intracellular septation protein
MKFLTDFFPIILFFIVFKFQGIYAATLAAILASLATVAYSHFVTKKVDGLQWITLLIIVLLGGATLLLHNELFIKWKPTVVEWAFALVFLGSQFFGQKNLTERMLDAQVTLPAHLWRRLNLSWVIFFAAMGAANIYVLSHYSTNTWVNFKMFGLLGFTTLFVIGQAFYISKHVVHETP